MWHSVVAWWHWAFLWPELFRVVIYFWKQALKNWLLVSTVKRAALYVLWQNPTHKCASLYRICICAYMCGENEVDSRNLNRCRKFCCFAREWIFLWAYDTRETAIHRHSTKLFREQIFFWPAREIIPRKWMCVYYVCLCLTVCVCVWTSWNGWMNTKLLSFHK